MCGASLVNNYSYSVTKKLETLDLTSSNYSSDSESIIGVGE